MKTFVLGDLHGAYKALLQVLERSKFNKEQDTLIFLGDVADGWSEVPECVEELLSIKNLISIKGNHDQWCYEWMQYHIAPDIWLTQGGQSTFNAYENKHITLKLKHEKEFFSKQIHYYKDDKGRFFTHGGFNRHLLIEEQVSKAIFYWDRDLWMSSLSHSNYKFPFKIKENFKEIYIGHTTTSQIEPFLKPIKSANLIWNLDQGAGFEGKLTLMNIDTNEYFQSDLVKTLYPNEKGR